MFFQEKRFWPPPCSIRIDGATGRSRRGRAPRFHSSATRARSSTPRNVDGLRFAACSAHGRPLGWPRGLTLPSGEFAPIFGPGRCAASLEFALVQPDTASDDDRGCIIDAAYGCLSEPHSGADPDVADPAARRRVHPGVLPALRVQGRTVPGDAAAGERRTGRVGWTASPTRRLVRPSISSRRGSKRCSA